MLGVDRAIQYHVYQWLLVQAPVAGKFCFCTVIPAGEVQESANDWGAMQKLFSADDHVIEHARVWTDRLPAKYKEAGPHVVFSEGKERWVHEGQVGAEVGFGSALHSLRDSKEALEPRFELPKTYADMLPGCYDPAQRSKDMLDNGVVASLCFPTLPRFGGTLFFEFEDKILADLCVKAYNDFILDEWCPGGVDGMFVPMTICQLWDVKSAVEEVTRCVERGARAITIPENTVYFGLPSFYTDYFDPLWRTCEDTGIAICMHLATAGNYADFRPAPEALTLPWWPVRHPLCPFWPSPTWCSPRSARSSRD